ncbi:MAG: hypothetical protein JXR84_20910 [Anaerolineae bacterium]|nr:hypothetical protein [Anaerolineae bacterium]
MSQLTKTAETLGIPENQLREFCLEVQGCFRGWLPSFRLIAATLEKHPLESAVEIAHLIKLNTTNTRSNTFTPPSDELVIDTPPTYQHKRNAYVPPHRVTLDQLEKCPHGVPITRTCAICNPKKFREETGID